MVDNHLVNGDMFEGKYRILGELGTGAFGMVYLAFQESMDRKVALKILRTSAIVQSSNATQRFQREVRIISKLKHPNTVTIHDFGETVDGALYMVLEYIEGEELRGVLDREGALDVITALKFAKQIATSLSEAHENGVVHRDLKPANIMITTLGVARDFIKVLDFGIAGFQESKIKDLTGVGPDGEKELIGTPRYMSPEQVRGETVNAASDVYNLGLIIYEMLCGSPAVKGNGVMAIMTQQMSSEPLVLEGLDKHHPQLQKIVRTATSKNSTDRFPSAVQMRDRLEVLIATLKREITEGYPKKPSPIKNDTDPTVSFSAPDPNSKFSEFLEKGTLVGSKYEIVKPIARGGFSVVYLAKFTESDTPLALKILDKNDQLDPIWVARFRREASIIRSFSHPNNVRILDFGEQVDFYFIAMEFVPGRSLFKQIKKHGALDSRQIARIILFVCGALEEAHNKGILHRDLKPSNIMLTDTDEGFSAKVLDFGSAKFVELRPGQKIDCTTQGQRYLQLTQQGVFVGTPRYAAPEQLLQENVDIRVDIYGLGMVMWEALVGDPAVSKLDYASCIEFHLGPSPWMLPLSLNTPPEFADIVHRALQKKKEDRYQNIEALAADLLLFLESLRDDSEVRLSISEASDPFFDDENFGDITGLEHDSDVPLLDTDPRVTPPSRPKVETKKRKRDPAIRDVPLNLQLPISEVESLELETTQPLPKRETTQPEYLGQTPKNKSLIVPYLVALAILAGFVYFVLEKTGSVKESLLERIENPEDLKNTLNGEFIVAALRSTGWILRQGEAIPYRDGVELRTLIGNKKGLKTTINIFECTNAKQVKDLKKIAHEGTDNITFGSTFVRWKKSDNGSDMLSRTLFELKKMQKK